MVRNVCNHLAFIMDGNGRWAKALNESRTYGHQHGVIVIKKVINETLKFDEIKHLSFFAFSTENLNRPLQEVNFLLQLANDNLKTDVFQRNWSLGVKFNFFTFQEKFLNLLFSNRSFIIKKLNQHVIRKLKANFAKIDQMQTIYFQNHAARLNANFFLNFSGKVDILFAVNNLIKQKKSFVNEADFAAHMLTANVPDIDLLVRTSNEYRVSNFLLWQLAYSELIFLSKHWPAFNEDDFYFCLKQYYQRKRRFGKV